MDSIVSHVYIIPRQLFGLSCQDQVSGPAGLSLYVGPPCSEDGCYAVCLRGDNVLHALVYGTSQSYECFVPVCTWCELGRLSDIRGFQLLVEKQYACGRDPALSFWDFVSARHYRLMYAMQASPTVVYLRLRSPRMPEDFYVVYRLYGIATKDDWWRAPGYAYLGVLSADAADANLDVE